jgi:hypothetical protein
LDKQVGDTLVANGVSVSNIYGSSEAGLEAVILPSEFLLHQLLYVILIRTQAPLGNDWEYFKLVPTMRSEFVSSGDGLYELIIVVRPDEKLFIHS